MSAERKIPFFLPGASNPEALLSRSISRVLASNWFVLGQEVTAFEKAFAEYIGVSDCVSVANGTDALELALRAVGVRAGDRVVLAANAGYYSSTAINAIGAVPCYVDIDPRTMSLAPTLVEGALQNRPAAVIITHLYGQLADVEQVGGLCKRAGVPLIEDCAQAHGARRADRLAGSFGTVGCFSFYPTKNLGAIGDGGAVTTGDDEIATRLRALRQYGWEGKYRVAVQGGRNSRLDEIQAAVLLDKLPLLDACNEARRAIAVRYSAGLRALPLELPVSVGPDYVAHLYVIRSNLRDQLRTFLAERGISAEVHYPIPDHRQAVSAPLHGDQLLPVTERACDEVLSLPCYPGLDLEAQALVIEAIEDFFREQGRS